MSIDLDELERFAKAENLPWIHESGQVYEDTGLSYPILRGTDDAVRYHDPHAVYAVKAANAVPELIAVIRNLRWALEDIEGCSGYDSVHDLRNRAREALRESYK